MNQIFLLFIGFSISILTYGQPISYSTAPSPAYNDGQNPEIFVQSTALDLCDSIKLVYLKVNYNDVYLQKKAIKTVRVKIRDSKSTANTYQFYTLPVDKYGITSGGGTENNYNQPLTVPWAKTNPHYFEMEVYNVRGAIQYIID